MHYEKKNSWPRILICAPSNNAIDEIAIRLQEARDRIKRKFQSSVFNNFSHISNYQVLLQ